MSLIASATSTGRTDSLNLILANPYRGGKEGKKGRYERERGRKDERREEMMGGEERRG